MDEQLFDQCPVCGGEVKKKQVTKVLRGGGHTAAIEVEAEVCQACGESLFAPETIKQFEKTVEDLKNGNTQQLVVSGKAYKVP